MDSMFRRQLMSIVLGKSLKYQEISPLISMFPQVMYLYQACCPSFGFVLVCKDFLCVDIFQDLINPFPKQPWFFTRLLYKSFENTMGKGEIARNEQFLLFPQCFLPIFPPHFENFLPLKKKKKMKLSSANSLSLEESKICHLGKDY